MHRLFRPLIIAVGLIAGMLAFTAQAPLAAAPLHQTDDPMVVTAGDIVECSNDAHYYTAYLLESIDGLVLPLGDNVYEVGSLDEFNSCYDPSWGRFKDRTRPIVGNHEYGTQGAEGYYTYFGDAASPLEPGCTRDCKGYYSYDVGEWHLVALNSETDTRPGSEQEQWLRADLAANPTACTLVYWHRPRFSSAGHGDAAHGLYQAAYDYGADILLSGHDHDYERFSPQDPAGQYDPDHGLRQFVVGTGGAEFDDFRFIQPNSEERATGTWGVLKLTLHPDSYSWAYVPIPGETYTDSGAAPCVTPANPPADLATSRPAPAAELVETTTTTATTGAPATAAPTASTTTSGGYTIQEGDTLFGIALDNGLLWTTRAEANNLTEDSILQIGQTISLPGIATATVATGTTALTVTAVGSTPPVTTTATTTTTAVTTTPVAPGTTAPAAAPASDSVADSATKSTAGGSYTVKSGDTIILIALANDLDWQEMLELNGLEEDSILQIGQELRLP